MGTISESRLKELWGKSAFLFEGDDGFENGFPAFEDVDHPKHAEVKQALVDFLEKIDQSGL